MMQSMTGFGSSRFSENGLEISVEVKSLNSKHLDANIKLPGQYRQMEIELRKQLADRLVRGKVDLNVNLQRTESGELQRIDQAAINSYLEALGPVAKTQDMRSDQLLAAVLRMPGVVEMDEPDADEGEWKLISDCIDRALDELEKFRLNEGASLKTALENEIVLIEELTEAIKGQLDRRTAQFRERIQQKMEELLGSDNFDRNRFEQEMIYYLEKLDISEELTRLDAHCKHFRESMELQNGTMGKKLGFISQEIGREINTIGSKANDAEIQVLVIRAKDALEKIKEQSFNIR